VKIMEKCETDGPTQSAETSRETGTEGTSCLDSQAIFGTRIEILIRHGDQIYRLRKTRHGKLILNK